MPRARAVPWGNPPPQLSHRPGNLLGGVRSRRVQAADRRRPARTDIALAGYEQTVLRALRKPKTHWSPTRVPRQPHPRRGFRRASLTAPGLHAPATKEGWSTFWKSWTPSAPSSSRGPGWPRAARKRHQPDRRYKALGWMGKDRQPLPRYTRQRTSCRSRPYLHECDCSPAEPEIGTPGAPKS